ncbi:hypothetical protein B0T26DRAFT_756913 [Lasiosphaeria miniovina]|uniref:Uncharacterized protein n=1 Tax=Lasiosphaeria miniovina TaxID=1954250 RepID=A0AA40DKP0_9PEZI|nr:uncharacterized protein B0T26DRAFT_756913 [Lasiosphaeria miniovina]KAK0703353.1 hypothetical protein B0T26DRAFT_756913 [Lasiosphaeria miniovina]
MTSTQSVFRGSNEERATWLHQQGVLELFWNKGFLEIVDHLQVASKEFSDPSIKRLLGYICADSAAALGYTVANLGDECGVIALKLMQSSPDHTEGTLTAYDYNTILTDVIRRLAAGIVFSCKTRLRIEVDEKRRRRRRRSSPSLLRTAMPTRKNQAPTAIKLPPPRPRKALLPRALTLMFQKLRRTLY